MAKDHEAPLSQLVRLQNKVVRIIDIINVPLRDHITLHHVNLGLIKFPDIVKLYTCQLFYDHLTNNSPELKHWSHLCVMFWTFFSKLSLFLKILASNCLFLCKMIFSDNLLDLRGHVIDHALNWKKYDDLSYKMQTY